MPPESNQAHHAPSPDRAGGRREGERAPETQPVPDPADAPDEPSGSFRSWYYANFASTPGQDPISARRKLRFRLRSLLREVTTVTRCKGCGWDPLGGGIYVKTSTTTGDGDTPPTTTAGFGGLETCGRIWLCPVCSAKIRVRRGDEAAEGIGRHLDNGGGAYFCTVTASHSIDDPLATTFQVVTQAWRYLKTGRAYQTEKKRYGIVGDIKAVEVTHGENGWHPHMHVVILTERPLEF
ncbi:hypothetical protein AB0F99_34150, partial [Nocardia testacea]